MKQLLLLMTLVTFQSYGQDDCTFDLSTQTDEFVKNVDEFQTFAWNDDKKEATIILDNGDTLIAHRGGCYHFEISGMLVQQNIELKSLNHEYIFDKGLWMARRLFNENDFIELEEKFRNEDYNIERDDDQLFYMNFNHDYFSEYYLRAEQFDGVVKIEIGYYFN